MRFLIALFFFFSIHAYGQTVADMNKARQEQRYSDVYQIARQLADNGNPEGLLGLAICYLRGQGVSADEVEAAKYMKQAADKGQVAAQANMGIFYEKGQGVPVDLNLSLFYRQKASTVGHPAAQVDLARMYMNGIGVTKDLTQAKSLLDKVINMEDSTAFVTQQKKRAKDLSSKLDDELSKEKQAQANLSTTPNLAPPIPANFNISPKILRPGLSPNDPRLSCISAFDNDAKILPLNGKIGTTIFWDISFPMLSNQAVPTAKEQQAIAYWADELRKCISDSSAYRQKNYSRDLLSLLDKEDEQLQEAAIDLYNKKSTYGKYNSRIQQIFKESKVALDNFQQNKSDQEEQSRARAAAMRDAQQRQEQQRMTEQRQAELRRQAEQSRIAAVRQQWQARCELDKRNAYEQYTKSKENTCNGPNKGLAVLCVAGNIAAANDYADAAFKSCMSGAPIQ